MERGENETQNSAGIQSAVKKLLLIWEDIEDEIYSEFNDIEQHIVGGHVVHIDTFEVIFCSLS